MFKTSLILILLLLFTACGGGGSTNNQSTTTEQTNNDTNTTVVVSQSFKDKELYNFSLNFVNHRQRYDLKSIDSINNNILHQYFDFTTEDYVVDNIDKQIFVDGTRGALTDISYTLQTDGSIIASLNTQKIYQLSLKSEQTVKSEVFSEYRSIIPIEGKQYNTKLTYLANFYTTKDLVTNESFETLEEFIEVYQNKPFRGSILNGLMFGEENNLTQVIENNTTQAGHYEIRNIDNKAILLLKPNNTERYGNNECFILDFTKVWTAECHLTESQETLHFYDKKVYEDVLEYMKNAFVSVEISI